MHRITIAAIVLMVLAQAAHAQRQHVLFKNTAGLKLREQTQSVFTQIDQSAVKTIVKDRSVMIGLSIPMPDGKDMPLTLERMSVVNEASRLTVMNDDGPVHSILGANTVWYRTPLRDVGMAVFTFHASGHVSGLIDGPGGRYVIGARTGAETSDQYVVTHDAPSSFSCKTTTDVMSNEVERLVSEAHTAVKQATDNVQGADTLTMEIAVEADYLLRRKFATVELAQAYITQLMAVLSTVYERDLAVKFVVTNVRIWNTSNDPYSDNKGIFDGLLEDFISEYRTNMTLVPRDIAVFITSRNANGGIAKTIGGLCEVDGSYCAGDAQLQLTPLPTYMWDMFMFAHEIGHVCGGLHTQSCLWPTGPLDSCVASESGTCVTNSMTKPTRGTIMSYCSQQISNGAVVVYEFHPLSRNVVRSYIQSAPCVGNEPVKRINRLYGIARDGISGLPLAGLKLTLGRFIDNIVRQVPSSAGDTVVTTKADGSYEFIGLGMGIYYVEPPEGYVQYPYVVSGENFQNSVQVADSAVSYHVVLTKGQRLEVNITTADTTTTFALNIFSDVFAGLSASAHEILRANDTTLRFIGYVPYGTYILVPIASKFKFVPNKIVVEINDGQGPRSVRFDSRTTLPFNLVTIALAVGERPAWPTPGQNRLVGGMGYKLANSKTSQVIAVGSVPADGVVVVDAVGSSGLYSFGIESDTMNKAPYSGSQDVYPEYNNFMATYILQGRIKPLLARSYVMSVRMSEYVPLVSPTVLRNKSNPMQSITAVAMPFPIKILGRDLSQFSVALPGYISFSDVVNEDYETTPLFSPYVRSHLIAAAMSGGYILGDDSASAPWHIAMAVEGAAPARVLKVEWKNLRVQTYIDNDFYKPIEVGPFSFQIHVFENGTIEYVYDAPDSVQFPVATSIGLRGNDVLDWNVVSQGADSTMDNVTAGFAYNTQPTAKISSVSDVPKGLTYRWELGAVGVEDADESEFGVYPIPATAMIWLRGVDGRADVRIINDRGADVPSVSIPEGLPRINVSMLASGRYTIVVKAGNTTRSVPLLIAR